MNHAPTTSRTAAKRAAGPAARWPRLLLDIVEVLTRHHVKRGLVPEQARGEAEAAAIALADCIGGSALYLPNGKAVKRALRDAEIVRRAERGTVLDVARDFGLSTKAVYHVLARHRDARRDTPEVHR